MKIVGELASLVSDLVCTFVLCNLFITYLIFYVFELHNSDANQSVFSAKAEAVVFHSNMEFINRQRILITNKAKIKKK